MKPARMKSGITETKTPTHWFAQDTSHLAGNARSGSMYLEKFESCPLYPSNLGKILDLFQSASSTNRFTIPSWLVFDLWTPITLAMPLFKSPALHKSVNLASLFFGWTVYKTSVLLLLSPVWKARAFISSPFTPTQKNCISNLNSGNKVFMCRHMFCHFLNTVLIDKAQAKTQRY